MNQHIQRRLLAALILALPTVLTLALLLGYLRVDIGTYVPAYSTTFNDSIYYWRQILTFSTAGFNGGYYTINEAVAPAAFAHFYAHGPAFPVIFGTIGRFLGWTTLTAPILNLLVVTAALGLFLYIMRLDRVQLALMALVVATFWPMLFFLFSNMQESLHHAIAVVMAYLFYRLLSGPVPGRLALLCAVFIVLAGLLRATWSFLFVPFFLLRMERISVVSVTLALIRAAVLIIVIFIVFDHLSAPYPLNFFTQFVNTLTTTPSDALEMLRARVEFNLSLFGADHPPAVLQRFQVLALLVGGGLALGLRALGRLPGRLAHVPPRELMFYMYILGSILSLNVLIYDLYASRDFRMLAPFMLIMLLLLIAFRRLWLVGLLVISNILLVVGFLHTYREYWSGQFGYDWSAVAAFQETAGKHLVYDPDAPNGWCNTVLLEWAPQNDAYVFHPELMLSAPAEMGISFFFDPTQLRVPLRSKYLLLNRSYEPLAYALHVEELAQTPQTGTLYLNLDAGC